MECDNFSEDRKLGLQKKRIIWIDIIKGICMIFIVISHSYPPEAYVRFYTPFFLTGFFFSSGYTFSAKESIGSYLLHKMRTLFLPYWFFGLINAFIAWMLDGDNFKDRILGLLLSINRKNDDLWFIMCLFSVELLFYALWRLFLEKKNRGYTYAIGGSLILAILGYFIICMKICIPLQLENALIMLPFMVMGYVWKYFNLEKKLYGKNIVAICLGIYFTLIITYKNVVNIHAESYANFPVFMISAIIGTFMVALLSQFLENRLGKTIYIKCLVFIGQNTFVYYAFQSKVIRLLNVVYEAFHLNINDYIRSLTYAVITCMILAIPAFIITERFPFLLGRNRKKEKN